MNSTEARIRSGDGFVLVIVLSVLVILTLLAAAVATSAERAVRMAQTDADRFESELAMTGTRETLLFMLATQRQTLAGLTVNPADANASIAATEDPDGFSVLPTGNEIRLDATPYRGLADTRFALQDDRGLLSINWAPALLRQAFYERHGIASADWDGLDAKRLDYQDTDTLHRLNGAEQDQYRRAELPPPTNRTLSSPLELRRVIGWDKVLEGLDDSEILAQLTTARTVSLNINTAPPDILRLLPGMTQGNAERMAEVRRTNPFTSVWQAQQTFGAGIGFEEGISLFAIPSGTLILWDGKSGAKHLLHWTLTPLEINGPPWRIDYEVTLPRGNESDQVVVGTPSTPLFTTPGTAGKRD